MLLRRSGKQGIPGAGLSPERYVTLRAAPRLDPSLNFRHSE
jgi:hypothetical protein